ncbi:MAG TPA: O-antigen ligase family protein [Bryobacteraceae bacterium]|nr:O-antigen ligase family protein [Bryobacteraceae bacterium]
MHVILVCTVVYVLLSERIFLTVASGGRGVLQVMPLVVIVLAAALVLLSRQRSGTRFLDRTGWWLMWVPYHLIAILLPVLGFLFTGYPLRTVLSVVPGLLGVSFLIFGSWLAASGGAVRRVGPKYLFVAILAEFLFASIQFARTQGLVPADTFTFLYEWDLSTQLSYSERYLITGRSVGTFVNPNNLGFWAVIAFWGAAYGLRGTLRAVALLAAFGTLLLSQSRGSLLALIFAVAVWLVSLAFSRDPSRRPTLDLALASLLLLVIALTFVSAVWGTDYLPLRIGQRFARGMAVVTGGVAMDESAYGRVDAWRRAVDFYQQRPLGTLGEPQFLFGGFIDSDFVRILLQGGPLFLAAALVAIGTGVGLIGLGTLGRLIAVWSAAMAINAMTANPLSYGAAGLHWMAVGYYLAGKGSKRA